MSGNLTQINPELLKIETNDGRMQLLNLGADSSVAFNSLYSIFLWIGPNSIKFLTVFVV